MDVLLLLAGSDDGDTPVTVDISAAATKNETAVNLGRVGLPAQTTFVVVITEGSADASIEPVEFNLQFTDDNGSTWNTVATITVSDINNPAAFAVPVGPANFAPEAIASASIDVRAQVVLAATGSTDDFDYVAFLAGPQSFPFFN